MLNDFKPIIKNTDFVFLWTSQILSQLTINIMNFLLLLRLFEVTGSTIATSFLWVAYALPAVFLGPIAAASVDMVDKKKMLIISNFFQAVIIFSYALSHNTSLFLIYGVVLGYSMLNQFYVPAELASVPSLVSKKNLAHANSLFFITQQVSIVTGFAFAGILSSRLGFGNSLVFCSVLIFLAFLAVNFLPRMKSSEDMPKSFEKAFFKFFGRISEGYHFIKGNKIILFPFLLLLSLGVSLAIAAVNVPVFAQEILKIDIDLAGVMVVLPAGLGAGIGALFVPKILKKGTRKISLIKLSMQIIALAMLVITFLVPGLGSLQRLVITGLVLVGLGFAYMCAYIPSLTFLQEKTPKNLRGRVFGNFWFLTAVATILPVIFSGTITELLGPRFLSGLLGAAAILVLFVNKKYGQKMLLNLNNE